jgi:putative tricarboxylic transport membrane protein
MSAISGFVASTVGVIALTFLAPIIAKFAVAFGPPEFACLMVFGLLLVTVTGKSPVKGFISMAIGLLLSPSASTCSAEPSDSPSATSTCSTVSSSWC